MLPLLFRLGFRRLRLLGSGLLVLAGLPRSTAAPGPDSLRQLLTRPGLPPTQRVQVLDELCWQLNSTDLVAAIAYGQQGLQLATRIGDQKGLARCANDLGTAYLYAGELPAAARAYQQVIRAAEGPAEYRLRCFAHTGLGNVANRSRDYARAERHHRQALAELEGAGPQATPADRALVLNNLADVYREQGRLPLALRLHRQVLAAHAQPPAPSLPGQALSLRNIGTVLLDAHQPDSARPYLQRSLQLNEQLNALYESGGVLNNLAALELQTGRWAAARQAARRALAYARRVQATDVEADALQIAAKAERELGHHAAAYALYFRSQQLLDTLRLAEKNQALEQLQVRFDVERQQRRIAELSQRARLTQARAERESARLQRSLVALAGLAAALLVGGLLYLRLRRSRAQLAASEAGLRASESRLRQLAHTQDQLLHVVGHDLRGPVLGFQGTEKLLRHYLSADQPAEALALGRELDGAARHLQQLLDNVLEWAAARRGPVLSQPQALPLQAHVARVLALFEEPARAAGVSLHTAVPAGLVAWADPGLLDSVLRNLLSNALKFTPDGGRISVEAEATAGGLELAVADTGRGLGPDELARLNAPAAAEGRAASRRGLRGEPGAGLGLLVSQDFARVLGGEGLRFASAGPGQGTRATLHLPAVPTAARQAVAAD